MKEQPEALRLAAALETAEISYTSMVKAAAELRRLAKVEDEWAALSQDQGKLESQIDRLVAQRDALLEALKAAIVRAELRREGAVDVGVIRAAIKAVEENT